MIGAPIGIAIGADIDVIRIATLAVTEAADAILIEGVVLVTGDLAVTESADSIAMSGVVTSLTGYILVTEAADTIAIAGRSTLPFRSAPTIVGGRGRGPVSAGRAVSGVGAGYGRATVGR